VPLPSVTRYCCGRFYGWRFAWFLPTATAALPPYSGLVALFQHSLRWRRYARPSFAAFSGSWNEQTRSRTLLGRALAGR